MTTKRQTLPEMHTDLFINGKWEKGSKGMRPVINPATGETLTEVSKGDKAAFERAIEAAKQAFPVWSGMQLRERVKILHRAADLIEENADKLALIMTLEQGKPLAESKGEIQTNVDNLHWNAEEARRIYGETIPAPNNHKYEVRKQPVGLVGAITPY
ncbi:aldehyde dehydrogenase family protein, partial [Jeotgalibaca porci]|uniref:aldehyde dehydrogenase family protein n=1 Tax=Jeotgalibaca porci TaxID=1868793 RepID=UPI0035A07EE4